MTLHSFLLDTTAKARSNRRLARERECWTVGIGGGKCCLSFRRWMLLPVSASMSMVVGTIFSWPVWNEALTALFSPQPPTAESSFSFLLLPYTLVIQLATFAVACALLGAWLERNGPRRATLWSAFLTFFAHLLAVVGTLTQEAMVVIWGFGILQGLGCALALLSVYTSVLKFYPDRRGMVSGVCTTALFLGATLPFVLVPILVPLLSIPFTFALFGGIFTLVLLVGALILRLPPPGFVVHGMTSDGIPIDARQEFFAIRKQMRAISHKTPKLADPKQQDFSANISQKLPPLEEDGEEFLHYTLENAWASRDYILLTCCSFLLAMSLAVYLWKTAWVLETFYGITTPAYAQNTTSALIACSLISQLLLCIGSDYVGRRGILQLVGVLQLLALTGLLVSFWFRMNVNFLVTLTCVLMTCVTSTFALLPALLVDMFGASILAGTCGFVWSMWSMGMIVGWIGYSALIVFLVPGTYPTTSPLGLILSYGVFCCATTLLAVLLFQFVRTRARDRILPRIHGEWFRVRLFGRLLRVENGRPYVLSPMEEYAEWLAYLGERNRHVRCSLDLSPVL